MPVIAEIASHALTWPDVVDHAIGLLVVVIIVIAIAWSDRGGPDARA